jgi:hypothetical protein
VDQRKFKSLTEKEGIPKDWTVQKPGRAVGRACAEKGREKKTETRYTVPAHGTGYPPLPDLITSNGRLAGWLAGFCSCDLPANPLPYVVGSVSVFVEEASEMNDGEMRNGKVRIGL